MAKRKVAASAEDIERRVLPHNLEAERCVLGALMVSEGAFARVSGIVVADDFFRMAHRWIFQAIATLIDDKRSAVDVLTLAEELQRLGALDEAGGAAYLAALVDGMPRSANVEHYARIVKEKRTLRLLIAMGNDVLGEAYDAEASAAEILTRADRAIIDLQRGAANSRLVDLRESSGALYADIEHRIAHQGELTGIDTGFESLNRLTYGWQRGDMIVLAARPSIGKTAFVLNTVVAAARKGHAVAMFSLEMRRKQLENRLLAMLSGVDGMRIMGGFLGAPDLERLGAAMAELGGLNIWVDDRGGQTVWDIRSACRRLRAEQGLDLVVVDYVQLMPGSLEGRGYNRNDQVTDISRRMKALADEVQVPVLLLSQLNRAGDARGGDSKPRLTDLRESGALEQDADLVMFLHRKHHRESGTTQAILEKQRNGATGTVNLTFTLETQTFTDGGDEPPPEPEPKKEPKPGHLRFGKKH